jgi:hypothetical protein
MNTVSKLYKLANKLDAMGLLSDADELDKIALALSNPGTERIHGQEPQYPKGFYDGSQSEQLRLDITNVIQFLNRVKDVKDEITNYAPLYVEKLDRYLQAPSISPEYKLTIKKLRDRVNTVLKVSN